MFAVARHISFFAMTQRAIDGPYIYFVTTIVEKRRWFFVSPERAAHLAKVIVAACRMKHFTLLAYCIQPNHLHLLIKNMNWERRTLEKARHDERNANPWYGFSSPRQYKLGDLMQSIKGNFSWQLGHGQFWQTRSIFKIIDSEEYLKNVIAYIRNNYKKMNLPEMYGRPPFVYINWSTIRQIFSWPAPDFGPQCVCMRREAPLPDGRGFSGPCAKPAEAYFEDPSFRRDTRRIHPTGLRPWLSAEAGKKIRGRCSGS